jgi:osmotically-inducible protein OsmY
MRNVRIILLLSIICLIQSSCLPFVIGGTAGSGIVIASGERSVKEIKDDILIFTSIKNQYIQYNSKDLFQNVSVKVIEGSVLLTGNVKEPKTKMLAEKIAWIPNGVKDVINEIQITDNSKIKDFANDKMIWAHIKARLLLEKGIRIANYKYHVINGIVYVIGSTSSESELLRTLSLISHIGGVKKVVNYVKLKTNFMN